MDYVMELGLLESSQIRALQWTAPKVSSQVHRPSAVQLTRHHLPRLSPELGS